MFLNIYNTSKSRTPISAADLNLISGLTRYVGV